MREIGPATVLDGMRARGEVQKQIRFDSIGMGRHEGCR
jgi:hypothetical protein